jgi:hypothetical protein
MTFFFFGVADVDDELDELDEEELEDEDELDDDEGAVDVVAASPRLSAVPQAVEIARVMTTASRTRPRFGKQVGGAITSPSRES